MADVTQRSVIEQHIEELDTWLRAATPSPAVRELRVRHMTLARVVRAWVHQPPHDAQIAAMLECVLELRTQVQRSCPPPPPDAPAPRHASRPPARYRTTRPPPRRDGIRTTRPPPRRSD
ncbi:MAG TPA: hypothetical protein VF765_35920 [Polyangiaceae bacterium]